MSTTPEPTTPEPPVEEPDVTVPDEEEQPAERRSTSASSEGVVEDDVPSVSDQAVVAEVEEPPAPIPVVRKKAVDDKGRGHRVRRCTVGFPRSSLTTWRSHSVADKDPMVRVWYTTNRKMNEKGDYTTNHDTQNTYGHLDIELAVAQHHSPPKKSMAHLQVVKRNENDFFGEIEGCLDYYRDLGCTGQILVSLHNYNVGFKESLVGAAHWHEDLNVAGPTISYSWPSAGKSGNYEPDAAAIERSEPEILDFLTKMSRLCGSENVHLVADGTACHGLMRVLQRMAADHIELKLGQIFLLAPDVDRDLFQNLSWLFAKYSTRTTMYVSRVDRDAKRSVKRHQAPRAGIFEPYTIVDDVDTIAIASLETDDLHSEQKSRSYEIVTLRYDMYDLMKSNAPPQRRLHLTRQVDDGKTFWKLRKL